MRYSRIRPVSTQISRKPLAPLYGHACVRSVGYTATTVEYKRLRLRDLYVFHFVTSGSGMFVGQPFTAGDCYFVVPGEKEVIETDTTQPYAHYSIALDGEMARPLMEKAGLPTHNAVFRCEEIGQYVEILKACLPREAYVDEQAEACGLETAFYRMMELYFSTHTKEEQPGDTRARDIANYIKRHYSSQLKIGDLCEVFFLSKNYLCTLFKQEYGITPQEYLINCRIEKAKQLLHQPHVSVAETAMAVGLENPLYFSRCFHRRVGMSPTEYRKKHEKHKKDPG